MVSHRARASAQKDVFHRMESIMRRFNFLGYMAQWIERNYMRCVSSINMHIIALSQSVSVFSDDIAVLRIATCSYVYVCEQRMHHTNKRLPSLSDFFWQIANWGYLPKTPFNDTQWELYSECEHPGRNFNYRLYPVVIEAHFEPFFQR